MQVTVTIVFDSAAEASAFLSRSTVPVASPEPVKTDTPDSPEKRGPGRPRKTQETTAANEPAAPAQAAAPAPAEPPAPPATVGPAGGITYAASGIGELIQKLVAIDRSAAVTLLAEFGAKRGTELRPDQFDEFKQRIGALVNPELA